MYFGFAFLILGTILILFSRHKWYYQMISIAPPLGYVIFSFVTSFAVPETFLIPEGFKGVVYIIHDESIGESTVFEGFRRVYNIPKTGVLFTKFKQTNGIHHRLFYYVTKSGKRKELSILDYRDYNEKYTINPSLTEPPRDSLAVFTPEISVDFSQSAKDYYTTFTIGKYKNIKAWNFLYPEFIDSLRRVKSKSLR